MTAKGSDRITIVNSLNELTNSNVKNVLATVSKVNKRDYLPDNFAAWKNNFMNT